MRETMNDLNKVLEDIGENTLSSDKRDKKPETRSTNSIMESLLGHPVDVTGKMPDNSEYLQYALLAESMSRLNKHEVWEIGYNHELPAGGGVKGKVKSFVLRAARKIMRPIITPIIQDQNCFNASTVQTVNELNRHLERVEKIVKDQEEVINFLNDRIFTMEGKRSTDSNDVYTKIDYEKFENHFRGSQEEIRARQEEYIPFLKDKKALLDLGCGRGEFLELARDYGINGTGVELYAEYAEFCVKKGLKVHHADALTYLEAIPEGSVDAITGFQIAEHLPPAVLVDLCQLAYKKLAPGGVLILETPNPTCLSIYTNSFYLDSTHVKPVHPKALQYYLEDAGFSKVDILYTQGSRIPYSIPLIQDDAISNKDEINNGLWLLSELIWGSQDYAVIAVK